VRSGIQRVPKPKPELFGAVGNTILQHCKKRQTRNCVNYILIRAGVQKKGKKKDGLSAEGPPFFHLPRAIRLPLVVFT